MRSTKALGLIGDVAETGDMRLCKWCKARASESCESDCPNLELRGTGNYRKHERDDYNPPFASQANLGPSHRLNYWGPKTPIKGETVR